MVIKMEARPKSINARIIARHVCLEEPREEYDYKLTHTVPYHLWERMVDRFKEQFPGCEVHGPNVDGTWVIVVYNSPLSDKRLVNKCRSIFRRYLRSE